METKKVLIIGDIHIGREEDMNDVTKLTVATPELPYSRNPMESLKDFLSRKKIKIDAIVNLGDVTNQGYAAGWFTGIKMLRELCLMQNCPLISTPGNHDYCLNAEDKFEDKLLKGIKYYPTDDESANGKFWADGFCIYECADIQFLICNSESYLKNKTDLRKSPNFDDNYLSRIKEELEKRPYQGVKIAIVHHHVVTHSDIVNPQKTDLIENADKLLEILKEKNFYCVIHGHKHQPRIVDWNGIHVVASGSLSSTQNTNVARIDNHFHLMVLSVGDNIEGYLESYKFVHGDGWKAISDKDYPIKHIYGFGYHSDLEKFAEKILKYYFGEKSHVSFIDINKIRKDFFEINTFTQNQLKEFKEICDSKNYIAYLDGGNLMLIMKK